MLKMIRDLRLWLAQLSLPAIKSEKLADSLPSPVSSILFVCKGNICRSPLAATYLAAQLKGSKPLITICSAGLDTTAGKEADPRARAVAERNSLSLKAHVTTCVNEELVGKADLILVMEIIHRSELLERYPSARKKIFFLGDFDCGRSREIGDPYGGTAADFEHCFESIRRSCNNLANHLVTK